MFQVLISFALACLINKKFRGDDLWIRIILLPLMLPPAVLFRRIETFKMFDLVVQITGGGPGSITSSPPST